MAICRRNIDAMRVNDPIEPKPTASLEPHRNGSAAGVTKIRLLRLAQVKEMTGLGKTKIYELQADGSFPRRVEITAHAVGWIESEVQAWLMTRVTISRPESAREESDNATK